MEGIDRIFPRLGKLKTDELRLFRALRTLPRTYRELIFQDFQPIAQFLAQKNYWRLLPWGFLEDSEGAVVIFDRYKSPILKISVSGDRSLLHPRQNFDLTASKTLGFYYEDGTAPYMKPNTLPEILFLTDGLGVEGEIEYRWRLSKYGLRDPREWGMKWRRP